MSRAMKDSGIEWIGEIPEEWEVVRYKNFCYVFAGGTPDTSKPEYYDGSIPWIQSGKVQNGIISEPSRYITELGFKNSSTKLIPSSTSVLAMTGATCGNVGFLTFDSCANQSVMAFVSNNNISDKFIFYTLLTQDDAISLNQNGSAQAGINVDNGKNIFFAHPILPTQQCIADYLDEKCKEIDSIIENTKATIEEYKKYKYAVIADAVTKGLSTNVITKNSGIDWIGNVPENWEIIKLKYLFSIKKEIANKLGYDILSVTQNGLKIKDISNNEGQISSDYSKYQIVEPNDFVMNHMDLLTGWVDCSIFYGVTSPDYRVFRLDNENKALREYFKYIFQLCYKHKIFYGLGQGVSNMGRWRLQTDKFINFEVPLPSFEEQKEIVEFLNEKCSEIDTLISKKQQLLTQLESYKKSLIYECVTGKVEV